MSNSAVSFFQVVMITGDNPLTACHVARELRFIQKHHTLVLQPSPNQGKMGIFCKISHTTQSNKCFENKNMMIVFFCIPVEWHWESIDGSVSVPLTPASVSSFVHQFDLCVTGEGLAKLSSDHQLLHTLLPLIRVFARVSPKQKVGCKAAAAVCQL